MNHLPPSIKLLRMRYGKNLSLILPERKEEIKWNSGQSKT